MQVPSMREFVEYADSNSDHQYRHNKGEWPLSWTLDLFILYILIKTGYWIPTDKEHVLYLFSINTFMDFARTLRRCEEEWKI